MLTYFKDSQMTRPVTADSPVWVFAPSAGGVRHVSLWLGDPWGARVLVPAAAGATTLILSSGVPFPAAGSVSINGQQVDYTANNNGVLTVAPLAAPLIAGVPVYPILAYTGDSNLIFTPAGPVKIALKTSDQAAYGLAGAALISNFVTGAAVTAGGPLPLLQVDLEIQVDAGEETEILTQRLLTTALYPSTFPDKRISAQAVFAIERRDAGVTASFRAYPASRSLAPQAPGFLYGTYRWRDRSQVNAQPLARPQWDADIDRVGRDKFMAGIGDGDDLAPAGLVQQNGAILPKVQPGFYWTGPERYYLPSDNAVEQIVPVSATGPVKLSSRPKPQTPLFVGAFRMDVQGYYDAFARYEYMVDGFDPNGPAYQFIRDKAANTITLNRALPASRAFLGTVPNAHQAVFDLPVYPVASVVRVVMIASAFGLSEVNVAFTVDPLAGTVSVTIANPDAAAGRELYITFLPAVTVLYETKESADTVTVPVDVNPAVAGISSGFLYLEHRKQRVGALELDCDKPRIITPQSYSMVSGLVTYGPVFYESDFALLQVSAFSDVSRDPVPGARLKVVPDPAFEGALNYTDPLAVPLTLVTGGDGTASFLYTPPSAYGQYLPTANVADADIHLAAPIPIQLLWNVNDGWLARLYQVLNNDGFFGKVGALPVLGEIPWQTSGVPGTVGYRTNGRRVPLMAGVDPLLPVEAFDVAGKGHADPAFNGDVVKLRYAAAVPVGATVGAYFVSYVGRMTLQVQDLDTGVLSNAILLDLEAPPLVLDESGVAGYLTLDVAATGRLDQFRLGGQAIAPNMVNLARY